MPAATASQNSAQHPASEKYFGVRNMTTRRDARSLASFSFSPLVGAGSW